MPPKGQRRVSGSDVFCGLRPDTPTVPPKDPRPSLTENVRVSDQPVAPVNPSPRPESLTLPFQNRDRTSHLISDEEFEKIMRQSEIDNPVPRLPSGIPSHLSGLSLRRTVSTTKGPRTSIFAQRPRPASANFSNTVHATGQYAQDRFPRPAVSRDPTLTALPRPPTKNDMAIYPSQSNINPLAAESDYADTQQDGTAPSIIPRSQTPALTATEQGHRRGHKRQFSLSLAAASMVESVKKRIKRADPPAPKMRISSPFFVSSETNPNFPRSTIPNNFIYPAYIDTDQDSNTVTKTPTSSDGGATIGYDDGEITLTPAKLQKPRPKTPLQTTWSMTKETASQTRSLISPITRLLARPKGPTFTEVSTHPQSRSESRQTTPSTTTITTSAYFGSTESSPRLPNFNVRPTSTANLVSGNMNANVSVVGRSRPWLTAPREVLGGEIERLENRTMELVARNEGCAREIEYLRGRIGVLEAGGGGEGGSGTVKRRGAGVGGMNVDMDTDGYGDDAEMDLYDKRKTWMTCRDESEDEE